PAASESTEAVAGQPATGPSRHILLIDDEAAVLDVVGRFLAIAGHRVTAAASMAQALEQTRRGPLPDLVILDLMIPQEDALAHLHAARQRFPHVGILLCTGPLQADLTEKLLAEGATDVLRKPFRMHDLWDAVRRNSETHAGEPPQR